MIARAAIPSGLRRGLLAATLTAAFAIATPAHAQPEGGEDHAAAAPGEARQGAADHAEAGHAEAGHAEAGHAEAGHAEAGEHEHEAEEGITNWWTWDSGPNATDPAHRKLPRPFGWALVNFGIFLYILSKILWKPLKAGWESRHVAVKSELDEASRLRKEAESQLAEFTRKVANADEEVNALLAQLRKEAEADRARIIRAAEAEAKRLRAEADRQIQVEIERARVELRRETVDAALKAAEALLTTRITADDQHKLSERYLAELEVATRVGRQHETSPQGKPGGGAA